MADPNFKIDFIGIGSEKAGTTWVSECLSEHPEIYIPQKKEIFFFNEYDPHYLHYKNFRYQRGLDWYSKQFTPPTGKEITGEFTPTYFCCEQAPARIKKNFPDIKLIFTLRDPVERAISQYFHDIKIGLIRKLSFEEALKKNHSYIHKGYYSYFFENYLKYFPRENIHVVLFDDIKNRPGSVLRGIYDFLGVEDKEFYPEVLDKKINSKAAPRFLFLNYVMIHSEYLLMRWGLDSVLKLLEDSGLRSFALKVRDANCKSSREFPRISEDTKKELYRNYKNDILRSEELLDLDLSPWKKWE